MIVDNYETNSNLKEKIRNIVKKLIVIDDRINEKHNANILINNNYLNEYEKKRYLKIIKTHLSSWVQSLISTLLIKKILKKKIFVKKFFFFWNDRS